MLALWEPDLHCNCSLRTLLNTIGESIPALLNVTSLLMLAAIIFAILGMSLFGQVILNSTTATSLTHPLTTLGLRCC